MISMDVFHSIRMALWIMGYALNQELSSIMLMTNNALRRKILGVWKRTFINLP